MALWEQCSKPLIPALKISRAMKVVTKFSMFRVPMSSVRSTMRTWQSAWMPLRQIPLALTGPTWLSTESKIASTNLHMPAVLSPVRQPMHSQQLKNLDSCLARWGPELSYLASDTRPINIYEMPTKLPRKVWSTRVLTHFSLKPPKIYFRRKLQLMVRVLQSIRAIAMSF